ncbi:MAG: hypothetical protein E6I50_07275 [Chloroflexi bacterium]|nr:MAG: hypothetical protein E6I50_07275 [Chloroflexota bacterium]
MTRRYVVLGNGIAGQTCAEDLRKADPDASIVMIAAERHPLYNRVALPRYLRGQVRREKVFMRTAEDYARQNIEIHFETWATDVDLTDKIVLTNRGQEFKYDAILIATGGRPKPPPWPGSSDVSACLPPEGKGDVDHARAMVSSLCPRRGRRSALPAARRVARCGVHHVR